MANTKPQLRLGCGQKDRMKNISKMSIKYDRLIQQLKMRSKTIEKYVNALNQHMNVV